MLCQVCGAPNPEDREFCARCGAKLLVVSGGLEDEVELPDDEVDEEEFSLDEHLLERISILEETVKRTAETLQQLLAAVAKQERALLIQQTSTATLRELLEEAHLVQHEEWQERLEARMEYQLLALEKREEFLARKERMAALYRGDKRKAFEDLLREAEYAVQAFDLPRAVESLEAASRSDPANPELACFLAETLFNDGQGARALPYFERVLAADPQHYQALVYSGVICHEMGDAERAEVLLKRAVELYPDQFLPNFSLGAVYAGGGELAKAVTLLEKAVDIDGVHQALYLLGSCLYEMGKVGGAIEALKRLVRQDPTYEEGHHLLGLCYLDRGWRRRALDAFRQAQRLNPSKMRYQDLVRYLSGQDDSPLPEVGDPAREWLDRAEALTGERPDEAMAAYRQAMDAEPDNPTLLMSYAMACLQSKRSQETETATRRILDLNPGEMLKAAACATLIEALRSEGRYREGNRVGRRLLQEGTTNFSRTIAYYEMAFNLAEMEEDLDQALDYARRSLELSPDELRQFPLAALGWVHYKRREFDQAVDFLSRSSEVGVSSTTLTHLGMALLAAGEEGEARAALAKARDLDGDGVSLEQRMMECLKASDRLLRRVQHGQRG
ncbi:MAG: tetratricopeptide repeat protein [Thermoanaerobaculia bacterium]